ncbi:hypothetical protein B296_00047782 [Ensete ventricosum]|uniref:Cytochrome c domain-containing protein n=1 Tax=Ensete ventricosum TaxID=4639 RepID=A0A426XEA9_ENSVE|nr:hypothetical protein B296_00047782 [Ensete ventricosum]
MASFEETPPGDAKSGQKIFQSKCAHCHTVEKGAGHKHGRSLILKLKFFPHGLLLFQVPDLSCFPLTFSSLIGPNLHGLFGKQYGTAPGYSYSTASKNIDVIWEESSLYDYLLNPKEVMTGNLLMVKIYTRYIELITYVYPLQL